MLPPSPIAAPAAARRYPALRGVTAPQQRLPVPSLADRLPEETQGSLGAAAPRQLPPPQAGPGGRQPSLPPPGRDKEKRGGDSRTWGRRETPRAAGEQGIPAQPAPLLQPYMHWGSEAGLPPRAGGLERLDIAGLVPLPPWLSEHPQGEAQKVCRKHGRSIGSARTLQHPEDKGSLLA